MEPPQNSFSVAHHASESQHVVEVIGDVDIFTAPEFSAALEHAHEAPRVIVDFSRCGYIDSTGISVLFRWQQTTQGKLRVVVGNQATIKRILEVTGVGKFIEIFPSVKAAEV
jgi:anti-anti-sigma factor